MATTFLSNATIEMTATTGATPIVLSSQANACSLEVGNDSLEVTTFGNSGHIFAAGLQMVNLSMTLFLSYGSSEVEAAFAAAVGKGDTKFVISPSGTTEGPGNPEYTILNCMVASFTPINSTVGEIATLEISATGGTWSRDITP